MQRPFKAVSIAVLLGIAFCSGYFAHRSVPSISRSAVRRPLYYHDPMHPAYRSDKPGIAPDCGMALEPVYEEESKNTVAESLPFGSVRLSTEKQQLIGIRTAPVNGDAGTHVLHAVGKVAVDETRIDRVSALADGVVRSVSPYAAGSIVRKNDVLATYFVASRDIYNAMQAFVLAAGTFDQAASAVRNGMINNSKANTRTDEELLKSYGVTAAQIRELARTREVTRDIEFRTPISGLVLARNVSRDQVVTRGSELFRIADLTHIWVLADVFENDALAWKPGATAQVSYAGRTYEARVSEARQFDAVSRTLKIRLEMENPGTLLLPDMFVDVTVNVRSPGGLTVPSESMLDTGRSKVVFVEKAAGIFEPRPVITGTEFDDRVQILGGLKKDDRVVVSGMFLLDSESRLRSAGESSAPQVVPQEAAMAPTHMPAMSSGHRDPVCGMPLTHGEGGETAVYNGMTLHFCSRQCKSKFEKNPSAYANNIGTAERSSDGRGKL